MITERNPIMVLLFVWLTCGIYAFYHVYTTTTELIDFAGRDDINPTTELLINIISCGLFGMYAEYRNQQIIDRLYEAHGVQHEEKANMVGLLNLLTFVVGATWLVATFIYQDELNKVRNLSA